VTLGEKGQTIRVELQPELSAKTAASFVPLFNGKDLTGWVADGGGEDAWRVEDGELVMRGIAPGIDRAAGQSYLLTERDYADFALRLQFRRTDDTAIAGVALRAVPGETARTSRSDVKTDFPYHLTVWLGRYKELEGTGGLWWSPNSTEVAPLAVDRLAEIRPAGEWNDMEVEMRGQNLRVAVNGRDVQNVMLNKSRPEKFRAAGLSRYAGRVGFLKRNGEVRFRRIEIKELGPAAAVLAPEMSEWAGTGVVKDQKGDRPTAVAWTFTERRGQTFKALRRGPGSKAIIEGVIEANGRMTLVALAVVAPEAKPRKAIKGIGEVGSEQMTVFVENPDTGVLARTDFKLLSDGGKSFDFRGRWKCFHQPIGWSDYRTITEDSVFGGKGTRDGPWERDGGLIITHYPNGGREWLIIDPYKPNELHGSNGLQSVTWIRQ